MDELNELLEIREKIVEIEEDIQELTYLITAPKNQVISDMPRGGRQTNGIEHYVIKKEKLERQKKTLIWKLIYKWELVNYHLQRYGLTKPEIDLMKYRYYYGYKWKVCTIQMQKKYPDVKWNENRTFRVNKSIMNKIEPNNCAVC